MYTDEQLQDMRFRFSRALEAINRQLDRSLGKDALWELYGEIDRERNQLSDVVWKIPNESFWREAYVVAYNAVDEAAQWITFAIGASDDDRPGHIEATERHLLRAVQSLAMS